MHGRSVGDPGALGLAAVSVEERRSDVLLHGAPPVDRVDLADVPVVVSRCSPRRTTDGHGLPDLPAWSCPPARTGERDHKKRLSTDVYTFLRHVNLHEPLDLLHVNYM